MCYFSLHAKSLAGELSLCSKANINGHPSIWYLIHTWIRLRKLYFHGNDKISSLTNLFQYFLSGEILSERKIELILPHLVRNFQINARNKLITKYLLTSPIIQDLILNMVVKSMWKTNLTRLSNLFDKFYKLYFEF